VEENGPMGRIEVSTRAISAVAGRAVTECYGVVGLSSRRLRDGLQQVLKHDQYSKGVEVKLQESEIVIDLYVILEYGTRVSEVARNIANNVRFAVERALDLHRVRVNVNVQGLRVSSQD